MQYIKPTSENASELMAMLYGSEVEASESGPVDTPAYTATFVNPEGEIVAACLCDSAMVIYSGAALSMMPPGGAQDMVSEKEFTKSVLENFHEVMNICTRLMMSNSSPHLKLDRVMPSADVESELASLKEGTTPTAFEVSIPRYGSGRMQFLVH